MVGAPRGAHWIIHFQKIVLVFSLSQNLDIFRFKILRSAMYLNFWKFQLLAPNVGLNKCIFLNKILRFFLCFMCYELVSCTRWKVANHASTCRSIFGHGNLLRETKLRVLSSALFAYRTFLFLDRVYCNTTRRWLSRLHHELQLGRCTSVAECSSEFQRKWKIIFFMTDSNLQETNIENNDIPKKKKLILTFFNLQIFCFKIKTEEKK